MTTRCARYDNATSWPVGTVSSVREKAVSRISGPPQRQQGKLHNLERENDEWWYRYRTKPWFPLPFLQDTVQAQAPLKCKSAESENGLELAHGSERT